MKRLCIALALLLAPLASAQNTIVKNAKLTGADNQVPSGSTLTIKSGGTFTIEGGGAITGVQATDATLTAIAGQTTAANKLTYWDGVDDANTIDFSPVAQTLLGYTTAAQWRSAVFPSAPSEGDIAWYDGSAWVNLTGGATGETIVKQADGSIDWGAITPTVASEDVEYDNATSGLSATDVQAAIDELETLVGGGGGSGDVVGPASATDNALARFDSGTGKLLQNSATTLSDAGAFAYADGVRQTFNPDGTNAGFNVGSHAGNPSSPSNGDLWYNSSDNELKARINGSTVALGAGGGATDFTDLGDVPSSYAGEAGKAAAVNSGETALEFVLLKGKQTIYVPAAAMSPTTTAGCSALNQVEITNGKPSLLTLDFDASTAEHAFFSVQLPKSWNLGQVYAQFLWSHGSTATNFGVTWSVSAVAISDDDPVNATYGTAVTVSDTGGTADDLYISNSSNPITVGGSPAAGDLVYFDVSRAAADSGDTLAVDARLLGIRIIYTTNATTDD